MALDAPAYSFGARHPQERPDDNPGPGAYEPPSDFDKSRFLRPESTSGFGKRLAGDETGRADSPGPGAYMVPTTVGRETPSYKIGQRWEVNEEKDVPGPAAYNPRVANNTVRPITLRGRSQSRDVHDGPGPGAYDDANSFSRMNRGRATSPMRSKSTRFKQSDTETPGPGSYDRSSSLARRATSIHGRIQKRQEDVGPGPAAYDVRRPLSAYSREANRSRRPQSASAARFRTVDHDDVPGPGSYEYSGARSSRQRTAPRYSFGGRTPAPHGDHARGDSPGPGEYVVASPIQQVRTRFSGKNTWGNTQRFRTPRSEVPGPGAYDQKSAAIPPNGTRHGYIGVRTGSAFGDSNDRSTSPGPGAYLSSSFKPTTRAKSIHPRLQETTHDEVPGPGQYDRATARDGPSYSITGRPHDLRQDVNDVMYMPMRTRYGAKASIGPANGSVAGLRRTRSSPSMRRPASASGRQASSAGSRGNLRN